MVVSIEELQQYTQDFNDYALNTTILTAAQEVAENYLGYALEYSTEGDLTAEKDFRKNYLAMDMPIQSVTSITVDGVLLDAADYEIQFNIIKFKTVAAGSAVLLYQPGFATLPSIVKLTILQIATLKLMETGKKIGVTGIQSPDGIGSTFINYTNFDKYLKNINQYRIL
jgi:hypothetical protein